MVTISIVSSILAVMMAIFAMFIRIKSAQKPATIKKIILPPVFMSTGFLMFIVPMFRVTFIEIIESVIFGIFFSFLLIKTSGFEIRNNDIYVKRSKAFFFILFGLFLIRLILKLILSTTIDFGALSGMFYILAFAMILPWRISMLFTFHKLKQELTK